MDFFNSHHTHTVTSSPLFGPLPARPTLFLKKLPRGKKSVPFGAKLSTSSSCDLSLSSSDGDRREEGRKQKCFYSQRRRRKRRRMSTEWIVEKN